MDNEIDIISDTFDYIFTRLTGSKCDSQFILRFNKEKLSVRGDMYFLTNFKFWKNLLGDKLECHENCTDILQHYAHTRKVKKGELETTNINEKIIQSLVALTDDDLKISKFSLEKERVCFFLNRPFITKNIIRTVIQEKGSFGKIADRVQSELIKVKIELDETSPLTNVRLKLIKNVCKNIFTLQNYNVYNGYEVYDDREVYNEDDNDKIVTHNIILTSSSEPFLSDECHAYVCGPVKNPQTNAKERTLTWEDYKKAKMEYLNKLHEEKYDIVGELFPSNDTLIEKMAIAMADFELLSVKPSRSVFINLQTDEKKSLTNTRGALFILYNTARINGIFNKFDAYFKKMFYPVIDLDDIDFSLLDDEDEWELVQNFLLGYIATIEHSVTLKPALTISPHVICMFVSRLTQKFSRYYRRIQILTNVVQNRCEDYKNLHMRMHARMNMLEALYVVLQNALAILGIQPLSSM